MPNIESIADLVGEQLNEVCFVMDYVEFHFNGPVLRALSDPHISTPSGVAKFPESGSRDQLCKLIGLTVTRAEVREEDAIRLEFSDGASLTVPLDQEHRVGPEAAHFISGSGHGLGMSIW